MKTYKLIGKNVNRNDIDDKIALLIAEVPENDLIIEDDYHIYRYVLGKKLYYVHVKGFETVKVCEYEERK